MDWQTFGFIQNPLNTSPVGKSTLKLFTGHENELRICNNVLAGCNARIVIEGTRGVGTTSFGNYLRFNAEAKQLHLTPIDEIKVDASWRCETLLAAIISSVVREIELLEDNDNLINDARFTAAKSLSSRISETYRSFGLDAFGFGANYGEQAGAVTQPIIVPATMLGYHLEDLVALIRSAGYRNGFLFQLNNLDVGEIHKQDDLKYLFNAIRDYTQIDGTNWLFVGDLGLRRFISQHISRLDEIISYEVTLPPLPLAKVSQMAYQ